MGTSRINAAQRKSAARRLRASGLTYAAIAAEIGITTSWAHQLVNGTRDKSAPRKRRTAKRTPGVSTAKLPARSSQEPRCDKCSRCGKPAQSPYICGTCKSALTVAARQARESRDPGYLKERRKQRKDHMRRKRGQ